MYGDLHTPYIEVKAKVENYTLKAIRRMGLIHTPYRLHTPRGGQVSQTLRINPKLDLKNILSPPLDFGTTEEPKSNIIEAGTSGEIHSKQRLHSRSHNLNLNIISLILNNVLHILSLFSGIMG